MTTPVQAMMQLTMKKGFGSTSSKKIPSSFPYAGDLRPGKISKQRVVLDTHILKPDYSETGIPQQQQKSPFPWMIEVKTPLEIQKMKRASQLARYVLDTAGRAVQPGVTTDEIDALVHDTIVQHGAYPSPLNYHGFPKSCCTSINEVICHGIPDNRKLKVRSVLCCIV